MGLRDRALIAIMVYTFARVGAVLQMNVGDYFMQGRRGWVRLHEKAARNTKRLVTTTWKPFSMNTSRWPGSRKIKTGRYSVPLGARPVRRIARPSRTPIACCSGGRARRESRPTSAITACGPPGSPIT